MFGLNTLSQAPFASLGGNAFSFTLTENINMADTNSQVWSFVQSITEPITLNNIDSEASIFIGTIVENFSLSDSSTQSST